MSDTTTSTQINEANEASPVVEKKVKKERKAKEAKEVKEPKAPKAPKGKKTAEGSLEETSEAPEKPKRTRKAKVDKEESTSEEPVKAKKSRKSAPATGDDVETAPKKTRSRKAKNVSEAESVEEALEAVAESDGKKKKKPSKPYNITAVIKDDASYQNYEKQVKNKKTGENKVLVIESVNSSTPAGAAKKIAIGTVKDKFNDEQVIPLRVDISEKIVEKKADKAEKTKKPAEKVKPKIPRDYSYIMEVHKTNPKDEPVLFKPYLIDAEGNKIADPSKTPVKIKMNWEIKNFRSLREKKGKMVEVQEDSAMETELTA